MLSSLLVPQIGLELSSILEMKYLFGLFVTYVFAVLPYFFAGWILGSLFRDYVKYIHVLYFADLTGSAIGCLAFLAGMRPLGAVVLIFTTCLVVGIPFVVRNIKAPRRIAGLIGAVLLVILLIPAHEKINRKILPESTKAFVTLFDKLEDGDERIWEFSEWNAISRIDVAGHTQGKEKWIFIDGSAWTGLGLEGDETVTPYEKEDWPPLIEHMAPYFFLDEPEHVLVIGSGGGGDIWTALRGGARNVDAIEINPTTYRVLRDEYRAASYEIAYRPGVETFNEEGRSFIRRANKQYDVIMLHGIDTFAALNAGAYVLSENYLYTVEAIKDYVSHLTDDGYLCINRWYHPAELPRLFNVCLEALYELGIENPERNIVFHSRRSGTILVRKSAFEDKEVTEYREYIEGIDENFPGRFSGRKMEFIYPLDKYDEHSSIARTIARYAGHRKAGTQEEYLMDLPIKISPVYDDSPFFFHYDRFRDFLKVGGEKTTKERIRGNWASFTIFMLIGFASISVLLFMFIPLMRVDRGDVPRFGSHLIFFACLGVSFIFVEIALMQRFTLLLGHPSRSLSLVLASLLFFAGVGSYLAASPRIELGKTLIALVLLIGITAYLYPIMIHVALPWSLFSRGLVTVSLVAPLGILMGMPFPTGLRLVSRWGESAVPWMWGVNGGMTVLGSVVAILVAIHLGFTVVLLIAAFGYALAWAMYLRIAHNAH